MKKISFIGAGNMAYAMAGALNSNSTNSTIGVFDIAESRVELFQKTFNNVVKFESVKDLENRSDLIIIAVKPQVISEVLKELKSSEKVIVSIAAGVTMDSLKSAMPKASIARVMPNTPSLVGEMAAGVSFSPGMVEEDKNSVMEFLNYSGSAITIEDNLMDAVTGVSGSGPAFAARIFKHFIDAGIDQGLTPDISRALVLKTFSGTAKLIDEKDMDIEELINMVSSPGGTTVAGRGVLESSNIEEIIKGTVDAAVKRSLELGK